MWLNYVAPEKKRRVGGSGCVLTSLPRLWTIRRTVGPLMEFWATTIYRIDWRPWVDDPAPPPSSSQTRGEPGVCRVTAHPEWKYNRRTAVAALGHSKRSRADEGSNSSSRQLTPHLNLWLGDLQPPCFSLHTHRCVCLVKMTRGEQTEECCNKKVFTAALFCLKCDQHLQIKKKCLYLTFPFIVIERTLK